MALFGKTRAPRRSAASQPIADVDTLPDADGDQAAAADSGQTRQSAISIAAAVDMASRPSREAGPIRDIERWM
jgi:hypothetical protein